MTLCADRPRRRGRGSTEETVIGTRQLLSFSDPSPVVVTNPGGSSRFVLVADHAGNAIPAGLRKLGLSDEALKQHIALDIGIAGVAERLARALDACLIRQTYSRLVIDCNRRLGDPGSIPESSDLIPVPGNLNLDAAHVAARQDAIYHPYHDAISAHLQQRHAASRDTVLVSLHSFTPSMQGQARPWKLGVLHRNDSATSTRMLTLLQRELGAAAGDNQPYRMDDIDNTVPLHADSLGIDYLELEVRQDLIADPAGQAWASSLIAALLRE